MRAEFERPARENRLAGTLLGMIAMATHLDDPVLAGTLRVLESLQANHRLVCSDVQKRWCGLPRTGGHGANAIVRCIPLMLWLRGPDQRLTAAALNLASAQGESIETGIGAALVCHWFRALYQSRSRDMAWTSAIDRTQTSLADLEISDVDKTHLLSAVASDALAVTHPIAHVLRSAHALLSGAVDFPDLARQLQLSATPSALQLLGGAAGGLWFGDMAVEHWLGNPSLSQQFEQTRLAIATRASDMPRLERWPTQTSASHPLPIAFVEADSRGRIGLSPCPGLTGIYTSQGNIARDLRVDLDRVSAWGANHVLCLLRGDDLSDVGLNNYEQELRERGIRLWHLPFVEDGADGWFEREWSRVCPKLATALRNGEDILIHHLGWDDLSQRISAELLLKANGGIDLARVTSAVQAAIALARLDASRLDEDE